MKVLTLVLCLFSFNSFAGFLIEPYAGVGNYKVVYNDSLVEDGDNESMTTFGGRLGMSFTLLSAGIDYQLDTIDEASRNTTSIFVGVDLPILLRFWGEYMISSNLEPDEGKTTYDFESGYSLGVGFTGLPFVSLNLEVEKTSYELGNDDIPALEGIKADWVSYLFSVSFPINL